MWNTAVSIKNCKQLFHHGLHLRTKKKQHTAEMMSVLCVAIFWVVKASSGEKSCLQFSIPTGSGEGGEGGVSHRLKAMCHTIEYKRDIFNGALGARETHWETCDNVSEDCPSEKFIERCIETFTTLLSSSVSTFLQIIYTHTHYYHAMDHAMVLEMIGATLFWPLDHTLRKI